MGDPRVCGGLNGGESLPLPVRLALGSCVRVRRVCGSLVRRWRAVVYLGRWHGLSVCHADGVFPLVRFGLCGGRIDALMAWAWNFGFANWCIPHACARAIRAAFRGNSRKFCVIFLLRARIERVHHYTKLGYIGKSGVDWGKVVIARGCLVKCQSTPFHQIRAPF